MCDLNEVKGMELTMERENKNSKSTTLIIICIIILILAVVGVSYAAIFYSKLGQKVNRVTTGTMMMSYSDNTNGINITNADPMTDTVGKSLNDENQYFDFTVSASMSANVIINYVVTASKDAGSTLPDSAVKVYLTSITNDTESQVLAPTKISDLEVTSNNNNGAPDGQFILLNSHFNKSETRSYRLRMWVASDYSLNSISHTYKLRVNVYGNADV